MPTAIFNSVEYDEGRLAFLRHGESDPEFHCPYPAGVKCTRLGQRLPDGARVRWWTGFLDARTASRVRAMRQDARGCPGR